MLGNGSIFEGHVLRKERLAFGDQCSAESDSP
jgi:hypothetical protein